METVPEKVEVPLDALAEIATHWWKLNNWILTREHDDSLAVPRYVSRKLSAFLNSVEVTTLDLKGQSFDAGLAVEVVDTVVDANVDGLPNSKTTIIGEMLKPVVLWHGKVIKHGEAVVYKASESEAPQTEVQG